MKRKYNYLISFNFLSGINNGFGQYTIRRDKKIKLDDINKIIDEINEKSFDKKASIVILNIIKL
jgi:hypothetical protein